MFLVLLYKIWNFKSKLDDLADQKNINISLAPFPFEISIAKFRIKDRISSYELSISNKSITNVAYIKCLLLTYSYFLG